jgi:outer membrane lipoprotein carrier protein
MRSRPVFRQGSGLLFGLLVAVCVVADEPEGLQLVNGFLNDVRSLTAEFEQTLINADGEVLEASAGTLALNRPGQFRWLYTEPYEQWLVADGQNIWSYDADLAQVTVKAQSEALANTPALLLSGDQKAMDQFDFGGSFADGGLTWVRLTPRRDDSGFRQVELAFSGETLARMVFFDNLEQTTVVTLEQVVVNRGVESAWFEFSVPEGVDVVGTPAGRSDPVP